MSAAASRTDPAPAADESLAGLRLRLAPAVANAAVFDGWTLAAIDSAADLMGVNRDVARLAFAGDDEDIGANAMAMIAAWIDHVDAAMAEAFPQGALDGVSVREKIRRLVRFRLEAIAGREEALRRALAIMAMPQNAATALRRGWESADAMWRAAGDVANNYNWYTKRATLAALYAATLPVFIDDTSADKAESWAFLDRRIAGVMRFEKAKAQWLGAPKGLDVRPWFSPVRFLGRLRYPPR